jgi:hypothetical protein
MPNTTNSDEIRKWVADNFHDIGEFRTGDVMSNIEGVDVRATSNVSSALNGWVTDNRVIQGFRLRRLSPPGKTAVWICEKAHKSSTEAQSGTKAMAGNDIVTVSKSDDFTAQIVDQNGSSFLVKREGKLYKVTPFKYS